MYVVSCIVYYNMKRYYNNNILLLTEYMVVFEAAM